MNFCCSKPVQLGGTEYKPGDIIPAGTVLDSRVRALKSNGYISEITENDEVPAGKVQPVSPVVTDIEIPIKSEGGEDMKIQLAQDEIIAVFTMLQLNADECVAAIGNENRENVLIMVHATDSRKTVKSAVKTRVEELSNGTKENAVSGGNVATEGTENQPDTQQ